MKSSIFLLAMLFLSGCASVSEEQLEMREYRDAEWQARFFAYTRKCRSKGGLVVIQKTAGRFDRDRPPANGDLYSCRR